MKKDKLVAKFVKKDAKMDKKLVDKMIKAERKMKKKDCK